MLRPRRLHRRRMRRAVALLVAGALLAGCEVVGGADDSLVMEDTVLREQGLPQAEIWIGSNTEPEEEPIQLGDQVRTDALKVIRATQDPDRDAERRARMVWTSRNPAVATVDSAGRVTAVSLGRTTILAQLDPRTLPAWAPVPTGDSTYVRVVPVNAVLASLRFRSLAISRSEASANNCAIAEDGQAYCWGLNLFTEEELSGTLRPLAGAPRFTSVTRGESHSCGLTADGRALCWGESRWGALGTGSTRAQRPVEVAGRHRFIQLSAGRDHTCGVTAAGELYCWGGNMAGELGTRAGDRCRFLVSINHRSRAMRGACSLRPVRVLPRVPVRAVAAADAHTCALDAGGTPWCWGDDFDRQVPRRGGRPTRVATNQRFTRLWAGSRHNCALTAAGEAYCWGRNSLGQRGAPDPRKGSRVPLRVPVDVRFTSLALGNEHTCGIAADGRAWCWGSDWDGMLGSGLPERGQQAPAPVARGLRFRQLAAGRSHTCGVTLAGGVFCWGAGLYFDLEGGTLNERPEPVRIAGPQG